MRSKGLLYLVVLALIALPGVQALASPAPEPAPAPGSDDLETDVTLDPEAVLAGQWVYTVKFVCGFNPVNGEQIPGSLSYQGESQVKLGNYATEINIFNPSMLDSSVASIRKKLVVLSYNGDAKGREPNQVRGDFVDSIGLQACSATMDDCNRIYRLFTGAVPLTPPPPMIGYWVLYSDRELDVDAVYTAEICSDWLINPTTGFRFMCGSSTGNFGAGISIDVERVPGRFVVD
jgi:hypothetical protein